MKNTFLFLTITLLIYFGNISFAQNVSKEEITSNVPELEKMHEVIYPIWHEAYPEKDYAKLRSLLPEVLELSEKLYNAKLPGILREKQAKWDEGISQYKKTVEAYKAACEGKDDADLLLKAEKLHADYEMLVRVIRPLMKEVDLFHQSLYIVYHDYLPNKKYDMINKISDELITKAQDILKGKMSKKIEAKKEQFTEKVNILIDKCKNLKVISQKEDSKAIVEAVEDMHTAYQNIEELFN